jgi:uncharacterized protein
MKKLFVTALLASAALSHAQTASTPPAPAAPSSPAKKELVQKLMVLQQSGIEGLARNLVEQPALQMLQAAARALQQMPPEKREAAGKSIEADIRKYVDETVPAVRERAVKLAPSTFGANVEEKFNEEELKQLIAWFESPVRKKYEAMLPESQNGFMQKLATEARPTVEPKLQALEAKVRATLGISPAGPAASAPPKSATPAKKAASK